MKNKDGERFATYSIQWFHNYITLRELAFLRAMDRFDIHAANIASAQKEWAERRLSELTNSPLDIKM